MPKRITIVATSVAVGLLLLCILPIASASAESPWWQVLSGSRPTHMWKPADNVQEITTTMGKAGPNEGVIQNLELGGESIGCLGSETFIGEFGCQSFYSSPAIKNASLLEAKLEAELGLNVEVTGGPVGVAPLIVTVPGHGAPTISFNKLGSKPTLGTAEDKVLSEGGSGRLVVTLTNLGDAPVDATTSPVTITDELPAGVEATGVEGLYGPREGKDLPLACALESTDLVTCTFEKDILPSYDSIEIEVMTDLLGDPPASSAPGKIRVSGGNAPQASAEQSIQVSPDSAPFGFESFSAVSEEEGGDASVRAGAHPFQLTTTIQLNAGRLVPFKKGNQAGRPYVIEQPAIPRNLRFPLPAGLVGNATQVPSCPMATFLNVVRFLQNACPDASAIGVSATTITEPAQFGLFRLTVPLFNLPPALGEPARFGFVTGGVPVVIDTSVDPGDHYRITASVHNLPQIAQILSSTVVIWGTPGNGHHDNSRGWNCAYTFHELGPCQRPPSLTEPAFLRQPVSCATPLEFGAEAEPWNPVPGSFPAKKTFTGPPMRACNQVPFDPSTKASPTSKLAENPSGLEFELDMPNSGLDNGEAIAEGEPKKVEVTLPEGMSINPSEGEGLAGCTPEEYARETVDSRPGEGCPDASKIGTVQFSTPLLEEEGHGSLYVASPHDNQFGSLIALYIVARIPDRGILIKQPVRVEADPVTGQLTAISDNLPQLPYSSFKLQFRPGGRAPLVTPPACGNYNVVTRFTPWSAQDPNNPAPDEIVTRTSSFSVERGVDGGACPAGGTPPFHPGLLAGTINNAAGHYSPFNVRLTRNDGEQEFTNFSIKLPPGVVGKLAGIPFCSDAAIAAAKARTGAHGGAEELASPSCPAASEIGHTLVGAGVGNSLTYVPGKLYLAGPYHGSPLSIVSITAAKVGPFDVGTVVVREALRINPETAEVFVDATGSDPIPHIIQGIPVHARDIRVYVDRQDFVLNPTSCERTSTASTVVGSGKDFGSDADNDPVTVTSPFQAADCASLGFKPRLSLHLKGKRTRGGNPALRAVLRPRKGDANAARISVALPHSEFLDQGHIRTVCTRVQFKAGAGNGAECPAGAVYGHARAWTPLLSEPLEGPVFLRSSEHPLPDLVLALHGLVDFDGVGRIDSVRGGIRNTFDFVPDVPITKIVVNFQGGKKGLLENSTNICLGKHRATVKMKGHNGRVHNFLAPLKAQCGKAKHRSRHHR